MPSPVHPRRSLHCAAFEILELVDEEVAVEKALGRAEIGVALQQVCAGGDEIVQVDETAFQFVGVVIGIDVRH